MKIKSLVKYQLVDMKRSVAIFYLVIVCVLVLLFTGGNVSFVVTDSLGAIASSTTTGSGITGMEFASAIFLFVCGLNFFKEFFRMFMQNGVSRKAMFISRVITIVSLCTFMTVIDKIILVLGKFAASLSGKVRYTGLFEMIYAARVSQIGDFQLQAEGFLFNFFLYLAAVTLGYLITIAFYRMNKVAKISVSVGVPVCVLYGLPILDAMVTHGAITNALVKAASFAFGFQNDGNPYFGMVTLLLIIAVFSGLCWLLVRRAVVKE